MKGIEESEARAHIERLLDSEGFHASPLQRRLLLYLTEKSLSGQADSLKEYIIGVEALGKPEGYDPRLDSSVRVQCGKLRQKLNEYYQNGGRADPVWIDFPKGHFRLGFRSRSTALEASLAGFATRWRWLALMTAGALVASLAANLYLLRGTPRRDEASRPAAKALTPALEEFWRPLLVGKTPLTICLGVPMCVRVEPVIVRRPRLDTWDAAVQSGLVERLERAFPQGGKARPWYVFTGLGEAQAALQVTNLLVSAGANLKFADSIGLTWREISEDRLVLIGPPKFIQQLTQLPVEQDLALEDGVIRNRKPAPGEPAAFDEGTTEHPDQEGQPNESGQVHAVISRLPAPLGKGEILVLSGSWTVGTLGAAHYVTSEPYVKDLLARIRLPGGGTPRFYQVLVRAQYRHRVPIKVSYVLHRVLRTVAVPKNE